MQGFDLKNKESVSHVDTFRSIHPKATTNLTDEEVVALGDAITQIHSDKSPRTFKDVFTDENGQRFVIVNDGEKDKAIPILKSGGKDNGWLYWGIW